MTPRFPDRCVRCGGRLFSVTRRQPAQRVVTCAQCHEETVLPVISRSSVMDDEELGRLIRRPAGG